MKIKKFKEYSSIIDMSSDFVEHLSPVILESNTNSYESIRKKIFNDLRLNRNLSLTYGVGINALYPIVDSLLKNMKISSIDVSSEKVVLLTICAFTIIYLEEKSIKKIEDENSIRDDIKSLLEELKMNGIGNGIVKKMVALFKSFVSIFNIIYKHKGKVLVGFIDMFAYISIMIPIINSILFIIGKYELTIDTFIHNFSGLVIGVGTIITKQGISYIIDKLKGKINKKDIINNIEIKGQNNIDQEYSGEMINEQ